MVETLNMEELYLTYKSVKDEINESDSEEKWKIYNPLIQTLEDAVKLTDESNENYIKTLLMLSSVLYEQARVLISKDELQLSLSNLLKSIDYISERKNHPNITYIYLRIINLYSYLQSKNGNLEEAKILLLDAEKLYNNLKNKDTIPIFSTDDIFKSDCENPLNCNKLEKLVTNNLQMLGWIYNKQNLQDTFVVYHHTVLRRQLENQDGNALTWVLKCARLSSYFLSKQRFKEARHHLAASLVVLQEYEKDLKEYQSDPNFLDEWEELQRYYADVARYWVKYGLFLFNASRARNVKMYCNKPNMDEICFGKNENLGKGDNLENKINENTETNTDKLDKEDPKPPEIQKEDLLLFPILDLEPIESQVTDDFINTTEQARSLFLHSQTWLKRSKQFYTIHEYTLDYVNAILDLSELYRYLAFYEVDLDSQYNVQKRRADVLETLSSILRDVRPQCYIAVSIELFRELAEVQMELLALNMQKLYYTDAAAAAQNLGMVQEYNVKKMEALSDIHSRLETFNDRIKFKQ